MSANEVISMHALFIRPWGTYHAGEYQSGVYPEISLGANVSSESLRTAEANPARLLPSVDQLGDIFFQVGWLEMGRSFACFTAPSDEGLADELELLFTRCPCEGIQLNMLWPNPTEVARFREKHPHTRLTLQIGRNALNEVEWNPETLVKVVEHYFGDIQAVLLDLSEGEEFTFDPEDLKPIVEALMRFHNLEIGVAGWLSAESMHLIAPLVSICSYLSVEAGEVGGKLRNPDGSFNYEAVDAYLKAAFAVLYGEKEMPDLEAEPRREEPHGPPISIHGAQRQFGHLSSINYWGATAEIEDGLRSSGRGRPICLKCGELMFPADDHGRYTCICSLGDVVDLAMDDF